MMYRFTFVAQQLCLWGVSVLSNKIENTEYEQIVSKHNFDLISLEVYRKWKYNCCLSTDPLAEVENEIILLLWLLSERQLLLFVLLIIPWQRLGWLLVAVHWSQFNSDSPQHCPLWAMNEPALWTVCCWQTIGSVSDFLPFSGLSS